ncbi:hypothetical protein H072_5770 [Dactylellina haptotyla CBS 200.50]|uniref:Autophagy-related protein 2 n=1 Tax=Dactylellina haptotyla (strain CBS 200.50) TaxID=1284197 RepID=S8AGZ8_DACHA|nr:hypothetical protein H072_5770 [Dactylellina haptotyla CBS 200.50]
MLGYIPRAVQLKLFRYALSKLDFLDHSTYDVERDFNLSLGLKNELEMKNIGLNVEKLTSIGNLPPSIHITDAKISLLRIRIPTDFHKTPVKVTVSTILIDIEIHSPTDTDSRVPESPLSPLDYDGELRERFRFPSGMDLTSSFFHERPSEAEEVDAALHYQLGSADDDGSVLDSDFDESDEVFDDAGLGTPLNFWNFVPSFFQRLVDRVEIDIKDISMRVRLPYPTVSSDSALCTELDRITVHFDIASIEIEGVNLVDDREESSSSRPRLTKTGMRALRLDGISISLLGPPDFFEDPMPYRFASTEDTDTVASSSTVLPFTSPMSARNGKKDSPRSFQLFPETSKTTSALSDHRTPAITSPLPDGQFFARMQEPYQAQLVPPSPSISPPESERSSLSRNSSFHGSILSEEIGSELLSQSFLHPESERDLSHSNTHSNLLEDEPAFNTPYHTEIQAHIYRSEQASTLGDSSDSDSLKNEPRQFDLFQEPNTKFLGVINLPARTGVRSMIESNVSQHREPNSNPSTFEPQIAEPIPRPAPLVSISQTLSNLEAINNIQSTDSDEYTYHREPLDDQSEYSNPDLLYLSQSMTSNVSSMSHGEHQPISSEYSDGVSAINTSRQQIDTQIIYTENERDVSDIDSIYESYPPSEADDIPSFISDAPEPEAVNIQRSPSPLEQSVNATPQHSLELDSNLEGNDTEATAAFTSQQPINLQSGYTDRQKISRDIAEILYNEMLPLENVSRDTTTTHRPGLNPPVRSLTEESGSEDSESVLAESMIFTHEEAGSLYMSALGGPQPFSTSLPVLNEEDNEGDERVNPGSSVGSKVPAAILRKHLLHINYVDIFLPGFAAVSNGPTPAPEETIMSYTENMSESIYQAVPGAFSVYAADRPRRKKTSEPIESSEAGRQKQKPNVSFQTGDKKSLEPLQRRPQKSPSTVKSTTRAEIEIGGVEISIDFAIGTKITVIVNKTMEVFERSNDTVPGPVTTAPKEGTRQGDPNLNISLASLNITLVDKIPGINWPTESGSGFPDLSKPIPTNTPQGEPPLAILKISMNRAIFKKTIRLDDEGEISESFIEIVLRACFVRIGDHEIIRFIRNQEAESMPSEKTKAMNSVLVIRITENRETRRIQVKSVPINFYFPIRDLEDMFPHFGGLESMLNVAASSNLSLKEQPAVPRMMETRRAESMKNVPTEKQTTFTVDVAGITFELFVSDLVGGIGLSTSPIKIASNPSSGLSVRIPQLAIFGPDVTASDTTGSNSTLLAFSSISISFDDTPTEEDLERLLTMITPSTDRFNEEDDLMIDVLLRQRRRGSVVRVDIGNSNGKMRNLHDVSRFTAVAEELAKMATVAKYIPQDERPGMLTLISVQSVSFEVFAGNELQTFTAKLEALDICHVAAPSLLALGIKQVSLIREDSGLDEEWVGESLPRSFAAVNDKDKNRPMVKVRMIGDELEPEIKIKIWNTRFEYHVESMISLLSLTEKDTTDVVATNMVNSIANLAEKEIAKHRKDISSGKTDGPPIIQPLRLNIGLVGLSMGLNPLNSEAKALFLVQDGSFVCELSSQQPFLASLILHKANLVVIDDRNNLTNPSKPASETKKQKYEPKEDLIRYTSQGYVSILTLSSAKASLKLEEHGNDRENTMSVGVEDLFIVIESCADSTQTIIGVLNGMKPPLPESEEIKYLTQIMPVDVFANLDENAFVPMDNAFIGGQPRDLQSLEEIPEDLIEDEIPFNSQLIESYYPSSALPLPAVGTSLRSPQTTNSFHEQVYVVAEEPLTFDDGYFQAASKTSKKKEEKIITRRVALKVSVRNTQLIWNLHDGYDWHKTRNTISKAIKNVEERASKRRRHLEAQGVLEELDEDEESATYDVLFNSIYITLPLHRDPKDLSRDIQNQIRGDDDLQSETGSYAPTITTLDSQPPGFRKSNARKRDQKYRRSQRNAMQFELKGVDVDFTIFAPDKSEVQSSVDIRINDLQVTENVKTSTWRMFLTYMREAGVRERGLPMAHLHIDTLRPIPDLAATELSIKVKLLPLRLYVDQDALEFLTRFFEFKDPDTLKSGTKVEEPFIQRCEIDTVRVKLDFKPKRVDYAGLRSGRTTEFMNFFILEEADMELRHVALNGVSGFERLGKDLNNIWMPDIKQNQLGGVLAGVAPLRSLVNIGTGVRDLVKVPIIEYRKDGRLVRSIKKGTQHFVKTSGSEVARLGAKLAIGTQTFLERTEEFLVGEPSQARHSHREVESGDEEGEGSNAAVFSPYADQPLGVYRGLVQAKQGLTRNLNEAKEAIMRVPSEAAQGGSAKSAAAAVFRAAPTAVIRPMIGVTEAVHKTLHGIDNTIDKEKREKLRDKYKKR